MSTERDEHFHQKSEMADLPEFPISPVNQSMIDKAFTSQKEDNGSKAEDDSPNLEVINQSSGWLNI